MKRIAVIAPEGTLDLAALEDAADRGGLRFSAAGIPSGALVALMLPNCLAFVPAYLALRRLSATVALIPPKYRARELEAIRRGVAPVCFVTTKTATQAPGLSARRVALVDFPCARSEEHTSELQSRGHLVCRLLLEKKKRRQPAPKLMLL